MIHNRADIHNANRIVIKAGTCVASTPEGYPSLLRISNIVEDVARLTREGKQVIIVSSGAIGIGKQVLARQGVMNLTVSDLLGKKELNPLGDCITPEEISYKSACAAAGQLGLMALYDSMFNQLHVSISQILVRSADFSSPERRRDIHDIINVLLENHIVPILNENDVVSANQTDDDPVFLDNDSLAALVAMETNAQLLVYLTNVPGVFDRPPCEEGAEIIEEFTEETVFRAGSKSLQGTGGMAAKVGAAMTAVKGGVNAVVITSGEDIGVVGKVMTGEKTGTLFLSDTQCNASVSSDNSNMRVHE